MAKKKSPRIGLRKSQKGTLQRKRPEAKPPSTGGPKKPKRVGALDAAHQVLTSAPKPMRVKEIIEAMRAKNLWKSPQGKTPGATLHAAMIREIKAKGKDARFRKVERGLFAAAR